ncbi:hypothetical protein AJ79_10368 [Helicocarpus griseus UAMH5409]|uniref:Uncharacterized protein n=1 Tax=Helicocarpus griseus UAMH5409 TaxID=1447875 RepID=A0A2B7W5W6_9EURO|nr:hypothetical protein AJ79_10368 [Helicocarpus griseus UAMH5409]
MKFNCMTQDAEILKFKYKFELNCCLYDHFHELIIAEYIKSDDIFSFFSQTCVSMAHNLKTIENSATRCEKERNKTRTDPAAADENEIKRHDNNITHTFRRYHYEDQL